jgi:O-antigen ligase
MIGAPVKWLVFVLAALATYPLGRWLRDRPAMQIRAWTLVGFLPFLAALDMALVSFGARPGDTNGVEVALIDWLALSLLFAQEQPARPLPFRFVLAAYLLVAVASVTQAPWALGSFGYVWKLGRMYLLFAVVCRAGQDLRVPAALLRGMMLGIVYEGSWALWQRFGLGLPRTTGSFAHQNTLGILLNLVVMAPMALMLAGRTTWLAAAATLAALVTCLLTVSRGALLFFGVGCVLLFVLSVARTFSARKVKMGLLGLALGVAIVPLALGVLSSRSPAEQVDSMRLRGQYERAATMMLEEHPLGVGANHFTVMLLTEGYGDRAEIDWSQRVAIVHNVYWLTAAELGYAGVLALVVLFAAPLVAALRYGLSARRDRRGDVLLGLGVGLALFYAHSLFEWVWRGTAVSYVYWMTVAIVAVLARQLREEAPRRVAMPAAGWAPSVRVAGAAPRVGTPPAATTRSRRHSWLRGVRPFPGA